MVVLTTVVIPADAQLALSPREGSSDHAMTNWC